MKSFLGKFGSFIAILAVFVTSFAVNQTCLAVVHQPKLPDASKRLRKF